MTTYTGEALHRFDDEAKQIVQSFLDENREAFKKYAIEKATEIYGSHEGIVSPPNRVVASFAESTYRSLMKEEE